MVFVESAPAGMLMQVGSQADLSVWAPDVASAEA